MTIKNAKTFPKVYYGLHMVEGVAEYSEPGKDAYRILVGEDTIKNMDPTFQGKPVYVEHVDEVNLDNIQNEADGYVMESFYNTTDGKHWVKFIVVSDQGHAAIRQGWKLSNAYIPQSFINGGLWHGVEYSKEITAGEYEHLAIVKHPRYEESLILTPEEFKKYNEDKEADLKRLANSKEKTGMKLNFFKRAKVENSADLEGMSVMLPKSGKEKTITQLVNEMDEAEEAKKRNDGMADLNHKVKLHDGSYCNVAELVEKHKALNDEMEEMKAKHDEMEEMKAKHDESEKEEDLKEEDSDVDVEGDKHNDESDDEGAKKKALELAEHEEKEIKEAKKNELEATKKEKEKKAKEKAEALKNAHLRADNEETSVVEIMADQVARGKQRYGSN